MSLVEEFPGSSRFSYFRCHWWQSSLVLQGSQILGVTGGRAPRFFKVFIRITFQHNGRARVRANHFGNLKNKHCSLAHRIHLYQTSMRVGKEVLPTLMSHLPVSPELKSPGPSYELLEVSLIC